MVKVCHRRSHGGGKSGTARSDTGLYAAQHHRRPGHSCADGKRKAKISYLVALGIIAGARAIASTWIGGFVASPVASIVFLAIGAGAVFQVVVIIGRLISRSRGGRFLMGPTAAGLAAGMLIMYPTTLLI